jgi:7-cyano-7-deazaguanine tRNA-ribosyltransferase
MDHFEIKTKDLLARIGKLQTNHGTVITPLLMPVIHPGKTDIKPKELLDFGFQMIITNSYIIHSNEKFRTKALEEGIHTLLDFDGPIMTDSGTFQMYTHGLPDDEINPLEIVRFQQEIGSDIGTILDIFSDPNVKKSQVESDVDISLQRAKNSVSEKGEMLLAGTVQGGTYSDLREKSAKALAEMDIEVHPVGGTVPLMEQYRYVDVVRVVLTAKQHLPPNRPVHLFGCGHPSFFAQAALMGCDLFDSASYAKYAEADRMMLPSGTVHLKNLEELPCNCPICSKYTPEQIKSQNKNKRVTLLMHHNLWVSISEIRRVRQAITEGKLFELTAYRARGHPSLYEAFQVMLDYYDFIERFDPLSKGSSIFYTGPETTRHPRLERFHQRMMERYPYRKTRTLLLISTPGDRPFSDIAALLANEVKQRTPEELLLFFVTPFGIVPWELEHVYPAQQCIFPRILDFDTLSIVKKRVSNVIQSISYDKLILINRNTPLDTILDDLECLEGILKLEKTTEAIEQMAPPKNEGQKWSKRKLRTIFAYQWMLKEGLADSLNDTNISFSKSTGKIRYVKKDDIIQFTMVPTTGLLTPTYEGGKSLLDYGIDNRYLVMVDDDASEFVAKGKSALAKFVVRSSPELRPGEEVVVVDINEQVLGVGKASMNGIEMQAFNRGVAVQIRHARDN